MLTSFLDGLTFGVLQSCWYQLDCAPVYSTHEVYLELVHQLQTRQVKYNRWITPKIRTVYSGVSKNEIAVSGMGIIIHEKYEHNIGNIRLYNRQDNKTHIKFWETSEYYFCISTRYQQTKTKNKWFLSRENFPQGRTHYPWRFESNRAGSKRWSKTKINEHVINRSGEVLVKICAYSELRINNTYFPLKVQHKCTFCDNWGSEFYRLFHYKQELYASPNNWLQNYDFCQHWHWSNGNFG